MDATQKSLKRAATDPGVRYTFYLLTQVTDTVTVVKSPL
jgi:hypothetical protein